MTAALTAIVTAMANVVMMGRYGTMNLLRIPRRRDHQAVRESLERVDLWPLRQRQIGQLSGGQRKRAFVARALAQEASVMLLDEPFAGVDIRTEKLLIQLFQQFRQEGRTLLISTHEVFTQENVARTFGGGPLDSLSFTPPDLPGEGDL